MLREHYNEWFPKTAIFVLNLNVNGSANLQKSEYVYINDSWCLLKYIAMDNDPNGY